MAPGSVWEGRAAAPWDAGSGRAVIMTDEHSVLEPSCPIPTLIDLFLFLFLSHIIRLRLHSLGEVLFHECIKEYLEIAVFSCFLLFFFIIWNGLKMSVFALF